MKAEKPNGNKKIGITMAIKNWGIQMGNGKWVNDKDYGKGVGGLRQGYVPQIERALIERARSAQRVACNVW